MKKLHELDQRTAAHHFGDVRISSPHSFGGFQYSEEYWKQLKYCAEKFGCCGFTFAPENALSPWSLFNELHCAKTSSVENLAMVLAFIATTNFTHSDASFKPFKVISNCPKYTKVMEKYSALRSNGIPAHVEMASTLRMKPEATLFKKTPFKVIQHAVLDTKTFELRFTYAEVFWNEGDEAEIFYGIWRPRERCKWIWPDHHP